MCHVPQSHEAMLFGLDSVKSTTVHEENDHMVKPPHGSDLAQYLISYNCLSIVFISLFILPFCSCSQGTQDTEQGLSPQNKYLGPVSESLSLMTVRCLSWITRLYEFYTAPVVKFWFHTVRSIMCIVSHFMLKMIIYTQIIVLFVWNCWWVVKNLETCWELKTYKVEVKISPATGGIMECVVLCLSQFW